ncbi:AAA family ATPase [Paeniglutamicibacter cryotolerans]|uniref:RecA-family ATPase n=1 Tax=Paeniglutamicibacter cryotolerans TaxID=670079 RepID=A0A839QHQ8_9MICC|nr:AAA family ATPase [Paeniglutamicibacter cryotolerans]MBB2995908.1 RecA-family ATPase [Paeniglutamicibacter cryotolerans]
MTEPITTKRVLLTPASQIKTRRQKWFWEPFTGHGVIPLGTATIAAGKGGEGKTTFMLDLAAQGSRGELHGDLHGRKIATIIIGPEDDWDTVMVPRLKAAGADLDRIFKIDVETTVDDHVAQTRSIRFPLDVDMIEQAMHEVGAKLLIVDPAPSLMQGDMNKVQDVRSSYEPLIALAQRHELALVLINHFNKGGGSVSKGMSGSHAWRDLTRSYLAFATDEETGERIFSQDKNNYGESKGSYKFLLESTDVTTDDGETASVARVNFLGETDQTVGDLINRETATDPDEQDDRNAAQAFLVDLLRGREAWEAPARDCLKAGHAAGFSENEIKNARKRCKSPRIVSEKSAFGAGWVWRADFAEGVTQNPEGVQGVTSEHVTPSLTPSEEVTQGVMQIEVTPSTPSTPSHECPLHQDPMNGCYTCDHHKGGIAA